MQNNKPLLINLLIILISCLLFIPFLGNVHLFDWDEINFAESAREMIVTGDYLNVRVNFELFWEKPPLFIWMQVVSMKIFGINEFAARFPNAIVGIVTLLVLFNIGRKHFNTKFGLIWVFAYAGSVLPHFYFKSGLIDPWFNLFIFLGIYFFIVYLIEDVRKTKFVLLSALFIGLGTLTKGPVALLVFLLVGFVYLLFKRFKMRITFKDIFLYIVTYIFVGGFWFILQLLSGNYDILYDFIIYQIELFQTQGAGHGGFFGYHFVVLLIGVFPASIFALKSFRKINEENDANKIFKQWMMILFWVILILFSIVKTKIIHYSSMAYFPLTFLATYAIYKTDLGQIKKSSLVTGLVLFFTVLLGISVYAFQYLAVNNEKVIESGLIKDQFSTGNFMAETTFTGFEFLIGVFLILGISLSFILMKKTYFKKIVSVFIVSLIFTNMSLLLLTPQAEKISQKAAIDFYKERSKEDAYFFTFKMKSYAHYFYGKTELPESGKIPTIGELVSKVQEKPVYAVCRNKNEEQFKKTFSDFTKLYGKNGYVFWKKVEN